MAEVALRAAATVFTGLKRALWHASSSQCDHNEI